MADGSIGEELFQAGQGHLNTPYIGCNFWPDNQALDEKTASSLLKMTEYIDIGDPG